ncbi:MAG: glycosyl hydrolase family 18 protein [Pontiella sp.]
MKYVLIAIVLYLSALPAQAKNFPETWVYLMKGEEAFFPADSPITDVACFSATVDGDGNLKGGHLTPPALRGAKADVRYHLVITLPWNNTLAHIYLNPELPFRNRIIAGIVERSKPFDGLQVDFESIAKEDGTAYLNFLASVKKALPKDKVFSVAVMSRWEAHKQKNPNDAFDYPFIGMIADRVVIMAYDEHYGGGTAGPIASLPWCENIYTYALKTIDPDKLIMGIPLYGRGWQKQSFAKAYKNRELTAKLREKNIRPTSDSKNGGSFSYSETAEINVHFETIQSLGAKMNLYATHPIRGVAFWRISQEPEGFWDAILK